MFCKCGFSPKDCPHNSQKPLKIQNNFGFRDLTMLSNLLKCNFDTKQIFIAFEQVSGMFGNVFI